MSGLTPYHLQDVGDGLAARRNVRVVARGPWASAALGLRISGFHLHPASRHDQLVCRQVSSVAPHNQADAFLEQVLKHRLELRRVGAAFLTEATSKAGS